MGTECRLAAPWGGGVPWVGGPRRGLCRLAAGFIPGVPARAARTQLGQGREPGPPRQACSHRGTRGASAWPWVLRQHSQGCGEALPSVLGGGCPGTSCLQADSLKGLWVAHGVPVGAR